MSFKGYVVSDYFAIRELNERPILGHFCAGRKRSGGPGGKSR